MEGATTLETTKDIYNVPGKFVGTVRDFLERCGYVFEGGFILDGEIKAATIVDGGEILPNYTPWEIDQVDVARNLTLLLRRSDIQYIDQPEVRESVCYHLRERGKEHGETAFKFSNLARKLEEDSP